MTILQVGILALVAAVIGQLRRGRGLALLGVSALAVFWLQPEEPSASLRYWLPFATVAIAVLSWALTSTAEVRGLRRNWPAAAVLAGVVVLADLNRYAGLQALYFTQSPRPILVGVALLALALVVMALTRWERLGRLWWWIALAAIILVFVFLKTPPLTTWLVGIPGSLRGAETPLNTTALSWLGFSYVAFRLMHTIRDRQAGRLAPVTLSEYVNYVIFFPAFTAGPIDRIERFVPDLCATPHLGNEDWIEAGTRLFVGLFKKFVIADLLAIISINDVLVHEVRSSGWLWLFLYAYAFRIYFDFSGYTDIAIGLGRLMGIRLPENFAAPYLKPNLTQFWNSWHITLTQWFRGYFFNPLTRAMRSAKRPMPTWLAILIAQLSTMLLIGLWHGITAGFVAWGLWHGAGLFLHNRWSDFMRARVPAWMQTPTGQALSSALGIFITFNYVAIGWLFFTLSTPSVAWRAILRLSGIA